jgi:hypothetical protein
MTDNHQHPHVQEVIQEFFDKRRVADKHKRVCGAERKALINGLYPFLSEERQQQHDQNFRAFDTWLSGEISPVRAATVEAETTKKHAASKALTTWLSGEMSPVRAAIVQAENTTEVHARKISLATQDEVQPPILQNEHNHIEIIGEGHKDEFVELLEDEGANEELFGQEPDNEEDCNEEEDDENDEEYVDDGEEESEDDEDEEYADDGEEESEDDEDEECVDDGEEESEDDEDGTKEKNIAMGTNGRAPTNEHASDTEHHHRSENDSHLEANKENSKKECRTTSVAKYNRSKKAKASKKKYRKTARGIAQRKKENAAPKGRATNNKYNESEKGILTKKKHNSSDKGKATSKRNDARKVERTRAERLAKYNAELNEMQPAMTASERDEYIENILQIRLPEYGNQTIDVLSEEGTIVVYFGLVTQVDRHGIEPYRFLCDDPRPILQFMTLGDNLKKITRAEAKEMGFETLCVHDETSNCGLQSYMIERTLQTKKSHLALGTHRLFRKVGAGSRYKNKTGSYQVFVTYAPATIFEEYPNLTVAY